MWERCHTSELSEGWQLRGYLGDDRQLYRAQLHARDEDHRAAAGWVPARVPGSVLADLLAAGLVSSPYVGTQSLLSELDGAVTELALHVPDPRRWHLNGHGVPHLYELHTVLRSPDGRPGDERRNVPGRLLA